MSFAIKAFASSAILASALAAAAQTCTTQSAMQPADRDALAAAGLALATRIQANDQPAVKSATIADFQRDFTGMSDVIASTSPHLAGAAPQVEQVYLLDATKLEKTANGANSDAQFYCTLNKSQNEADFTIPQLPPGRYGFAMVGFPASAAPWRLSLLLRQDSGQWKLAGLYPKALTAGGHDGLWYWRQARTLASSKEAWNAWLYFNEAQSLLTPAGFVSSTHLEKLQAELANAAPPAVSGGLTAETPLVVKGPDGAEYRFTSIATDDSLAATHPGQGVDIAAHLKIDALGDAATARKRNLDAMAALAAAHPEFRRAFHGIWIFAEVPGQSPYATEQAMADIH